MQNLEFKNKKHFKKMKKMITFLKGNLIADKNFNDESLQFHYDDSDFYVEDLIEELTNYVEKLVEENENLKQLLRENTKAIEYSQNSSIKKSIDFL